MNKQLSQLKRDYENIKAPDSLKERSRALMEQIKYEEKQRANGSERMEADTGRNTVGKGCKGQSWRRWAAVAAAAALMFTGGLNISQSFAATVAQLPGMEGIVKVLTLDRYDFSENGLDAHIVTPKIEGLLDQELEKKINDELAHTAQQLIDEFEESKEKLQEMFPGEEVHMGVGFDYNIKTDNEDLLVIDTYMYNVVGSSTTIHKYYNIDKKNGTILSLPELMEDHPDYVQDLSAYIRSEMERRNGEEDESFYIDPEDELMGEAAFTQISPEQLFYINSDGLLVICFEKYEVAPGYMGSPEFVIPAEYYNWQAQ